MIIIMKPEAKENEVNAVVQRLHSQDKEVHCTWLNGRAVIVAVGG